MKKDGKPYWADDGLLVYRDATVYVCDAEDTEAGGYDVHLCVGDDDRLDHIYLDSNATLCNRSTLTESWSDAAGWLRVTASTMNELADYIMENDYFADENEVGA